MYDKNDTIADMIGSKKDISEDKRPQVPGVADLATPNTPGNEMPRNFVPQKADAVQKSIGGYPDPAI